LGGSGNNGESCIIESEDGFIGIIDCFTDRIQKKPIPQHFLEHHQITLDKVKFILISHLHGDHCDGVVDLIKNYPLAKLYISQINLLKSFRTLIKFQHPNLKFSGWTKGQKLFKYLSDNPDRQIEGLTEGDEIFFTDDIQLNVLYPSQDCINYFDKFYKEKLDKITSKVKDIESRKNSNLPKVLDIDFSNNFNDHSVVIEALSNEFNSIYLGAQLRSVPFFHLVFMMFSKIISQRPDNKAPLRKYSFSTFFFSQKVEGFLNRRFITLLIADSTMPLPHIKLFSLKSAYCVFSVCLSK